MRKFFLVLMVLVAIPAMAQERGRSRTDSDQRPRSTVSRPAQSRPQVSRSRPAPRQRVVVVRPSYRPYYRPYYRSYYNGYGYYGRYYGGGYYGYYSVPLLRSYTTGLRFDLELIPKNEREMVKRGVVVVDGAEVGIVDKYDNWPSEIPVASGEHGVVVELEDGRVFQTKVFVQPGQILHVYPRFPLATSQP